MFHLQKPGVEHGTLQFYRFSWSGRSAFDVMNYIQGMVRASQVLTSNKSEGLKLWLRVQTFFMARLDSGEKYRKAKSFLICFSFSNDRLLARLLLHVLIFNGGFFSPGSWDWPNLTTHRLSQLTWSRSFQATNYNNKSIKFSKILFWWNSWPHKHIWSHLFKTCTSTCRCESECKPVVLQGNYHSLWFIVQSSLGMIYT